MFQSLRWRLQFWYALILVLVIAGFGTLLLVKLRQARFDEIDTELQAAALNLQEQLQVHFTPATLDEHEAGTEKKLAGLDLPHSLRKRYGDGEAAPYLVIWREDGSILKETADAVPSPEGVPAVRQRGSYREVIVAGPEQTRILVGRLITADLAELGQSTWQVTVIGLGVLLIGLVGSWWLAHSAVAPIQAMSAAASTMAGASQARPINLSGVYIELDQLGQNFNALLDRLEATFKQQARFTADASHELRTPLTVLLTQIELALSAPRPAEQYRQTIESCLRAAQRMKALVEDLLILARADAGKLALRLQRLDLKQVVEDAAALLEPLAGKKQIGINVTGESVPVQGDPDRLAQVVTNLLSNAIFYNRPMGKVQLRVTGDRGEAVLAVADTGEGIPAKDLPHLFERFYRVDKARSRVTGGSGLGLAICKSIIETHGGTISVTSVTDAGTTFVVRLPRDQETVPQLKD